MEINEKQINKTQIKSKKRVSDHGEVFTNEREVKAMCDLVDDETKRIDSRFLEPACGDGNFLAEILTRKLQRVNKDYKKSSYDWERNSLLALGSMYGVDILQDNVILCRKRLFDIWNNSYKSICKKEVNEDTKKSAQFILNKNIVCGDALTLKKVDENTNAINEPIVFSEWTFPFNDARMQRKDYTFSELLERNSKNSKEEQISITNDDESRFIEQYICYYRQLAK